MTNEEAREHMDILIAHKDKALETHPYFKRCDSCIHSEERDGSNCYECIKGMADNFEAQPTKMRDATEEERKSVKDYVESISKPTGFNFYDEAHPTDAVSKLPSVTPRTNLAETSQDCIGREEAKRFLYERIDRLNDDELYDIFSRIIDDMYNELPSVTLERPKGKWIDVNGDKSLFECSKCGDKVCCANNNYCPNCGAEMNGGEEDEVNN